MKRIYISNITYRVTSNSSRIRDYGEIPILLAVVHDNSYSYWFTYYQQMYAQGYEF